MRNRVAWKEALAGSLLGIALLTAACEQAGAPVPRLRAVGRVLDERAQPLAGVVVTDMRHSVLSDAQGRFSFRITASRLRFLKPGYRPQVVAHQAEKPIRVKLLRRVESQAVRLYRSSGQATYRYLEDYLAKVSRVAVAETLTELKVADVLLLLTPQRNLARETGRVLDWVKGGGRLIVCGEWGGYAEADMETLNALTRPAGIVFTGSTLKDPAASDFRLEASVVDLPPHQNMTLLMFGATALKVRAPARAIVRLGGPVYSIQSTANGGVAAAVAPWGAGKIFALGDSSLWRDDDSSGAGVPNAELSGHQQFLQALLEW